MSLSSKKHLEELIEYAWLNLPDLDKLQIKNPLVNRTKFDLDNPHIHLLNLIRRPEYFHFTCKEILNVNLLPYQNVILQELWTHKYPILIMSRGGSKSFLLGLYSLLRALLIQGSKVILVGSAFRQAKVMFEYAESIWNNAPVLRSMLDQSDNRQKPRRDIDRVQITLGKSTIIGIPLADGCLTQSCMTTCNDGVTTILENNEVDTHSYKRTQKIWSNGSFVSSDEWYNNGERPTKKIITEDGFEIEGTHNHKIKVLRRGLVEWCRLDALCVGDYVLIDRSVRWHSNRTDITEGEAYAVGLMIGNGHWTNKYRIGFATIDDAELIPALKVIGDNWRHYDGAHWMLHGKQMRRQWLDRFQIKVCKSHDKEIPPVILKSSKKVLSACLSGLFDTDGTLQVSTAKGGVGITVSYTTVSQKLADQIQFLLLHYGIIARKKGRWRQDFRKPDQWNYIYELLITGSDVKIFMDEINFWLKRKRLVLEQGAAQKTRWLTNGDEVPFVRDLMIDICKEYRIKRAVVEKRFNDISPQKLRRLKIITRNVIKTFLEKFNYVIDDRIDIIRQLGVDNIYYNKVQSISNGYAATFDIHVPTTHEYCANGFFSHNSKVRGLRASTLISDEFNSINTEVYETVVSGFASVNLDPVSKVKEAARRRLLKKLGELPAELDNPMDFGNQAIISGTSGYSFESFHKYWKRYKAIIESKGDKRRLLEIFDGNVPAKFNWKNYSIIRIPYDLLPEDYMDEEHIARSKATQHVGTFNSEFGSVFISDSNGFFKRSLIESCVTKIPVISPMGTSVQFKASLLGHKQLRYVFGIDPASERDNFAVVILELHPDHRRIVYGWSTNARSHKERLNKGFVKETDYYAYCVRKIRDLMKVFPTCALALDSQGGGKAIEETLHRVDSLQPGELPIWRVVDPEKPQEWDRYSGEHILHSINFADADWCGEANHGMRKDFEDKLLLFPFFDSISLAQAWEEDQSSGRQFDTYEDCVMEIEELKTELSIIIQSRTPSGRDHWDTPEIKAEGSKKGRMFKDRYSALVMANMVARQLQAPAPLQQEYLPVGGFAHQLAEFNVVKPIRGSMYGGAVPDGLKTATQNPMNYGAIIRR